ncbi:MAG: DNA-binding response regulator [Acidimicrobiales bacterium]|nr:DNA-binding response regulator [Acidimicrobiales bacterium]
MVDTEPVAREGVMRVLTMGGCRVLGEAATGRNAVDLVRAVAPDVVVAEVPLPDLGTPEFCRAVTETRAETGIVVFSGRHERLLDAFAAGARAVVTKRAYGGVFVDAVRAAAAGATFIDPALATAAWLAAPPGSRKAISPAGLTVQELRVLALLPKGLTNEQIAVQLHVSRDTVKTHVANAQRKLRVQSRTEAAVAALQLGLG